MSHSEVPQPERYEQEPDAYQRRHVLEPDWRSQGILDAHNRYRMYFRNYRSSERNC